MACFCLDHIPAAYCFPRLQATSSWLQSEGKCKYNQGIIACGIAGFSAQHTMGYCNRHCCHVPTTADRHHRQSSWADVTHRHHRQTPTGNHRQWTGTISKHHRQTNQQPPMQLLQQTRQALLCFSIGADHALHFVHSVLCCLQLAVDLHVAAIEWQQLA